MTYIFGMHTLKLSNSSILLSRYFDEVCVAHIFSFLCCVVFFVLFVYYTGTCVCLMLPVSLDCTFLLAPFLFSNVYSYCVLCGQCCQCLWIVHSCFLLRFPLTFILKKKQSVFLHNYSILST